MHRNRRLIKFLRFKFQDLVTSCAPHDTCTHNNHVANTVVLGFFADKFTPVPKSQSVCTKQDEVYTAHGEPVTDGFLDTKLQSLDQVDIVPVYTFFHY